MSLIWEKKKTAMMDYICRDDILWMIAYLDITVDFQQLVGETIRKLTCLQRVNDPHNRPGNGKFSKNLRTNQSSEPTQPKSLELLGLSKVNE